MQKYWKHTNNFRKVGIFFSKWPLWKKVWAVTGLLIFLAYWVSLPRKLFLAPPSMVLVDRSGVLLCARIAADGQWRFPATDTVPEKFVMAITHFEDKRFFRHIGVDILALGRALVQNVRAGHIKSGGSTISMQVIRLARGKHHRNVLQKFIEIILATRLEIRYSKNEILQLYAANAPFGGNVVGLEAASWRYFGKQAGMISWAEAATLAVLPNTPGLIHPGRNRSALLEKRNRLLDKLYTNGLLDSLDCDLAKQEPLPDKPHPLPQLAPHLFDRTTKELPSARATSSYIFTTLLADLQSKIQDILVRRGKELAQNGVFNAAAIVADVSTGEVLAYCGNIPAAGLDHAEAVDVIMAPRSTGSIIKPILYSLALQEGVVAPQTLLPDIPTSLAGYRPENFRERFEGVVASQKALIRSLNVPFVYLLQQYGLEKFHFELQKLGFSHLNFPAVHYGLPLVLGGAEACLWDITQTYAGMARTLINFHDRSGLYAKSDFAGLHYLVSEHDKTTGQKGLKEAPFLEAGAIWFTFEAMRQVERPNSSGAWERFESGQPIAWKTGTSFGFRDAWAIGVNRKYVVGVWAGNADGEGRPGLVGVLAAGPVLFDIFKLLPPQPWFDPPYDELTKIAICKNSGYKASTICPADTVWGTHMAGELRTCPYHQLIHLDGSLQWRVDADCEPANKIEARPWFILPPVEEHFFVTKNHDYKPLPPLRQDCSKNSDGQKSMELIYPKSLTRIYVPLDLDGQKSQTIFSVAHRKPNTTVLWHIDNYFIGSTKNFHSMALSPTPGDHRLTLVDENGERLELEFEIIGKEDE